MTAPAITARRAAVRVGGRPLWSDVDLTVGAGDCVAVLGPNGVGKSSLVKAVLGAVPLSSGELTVLGRPAGAAREEIGYLPQRRSFEASVRVRGMDLVRLGLDGDRWGLPLPSRWSARSRRASERVCEVIETVGAGAYAGRPIGELSGGEQQRLLIAQALVRRPRLLILDEPLDSLDLPHQAGVAALIAAISAEHDVTVVIVAHDVNPILPYLDRVVYLAGGRAVSGLPAEVINGPTLSRLYGTHIEVLTTATGRLVVVGEPVSHHGHPDTRGWAGP